MKYFILITFCLWSVHSSGQLNSSMPPEATIFYNKAINIISLEIRTLVLTNSQNIKRNKTDANQLLSELKKEPRLRKLKKAEIDWIAILIMVQASKNTDDEIKMKVLELRKNPGEEGIDEINRLSEFKSFLALNTTQLLDNTTISQETALNNLKP